MGYFFTRNRVTWNDQEIVPYARHHIILSMLKRNDVYMNSETWKESIGITNAPDKDDIYEKDSPMGLLTTI